jgi:hypothetical protein
VELDSISGIMWNFAELRGCGDGTFRGDRE